MKELLKKILATGWLNNELSCEVEELLAQPEHIPDIRNMVEPVAWLHEWVDEIGEHVKSVVYNFYDDANLIPLYTAPPKREPLSDYATYDMFRASKQAVTASCYWAGIRDAEKAHGIGVDDE